MHNKITMSDVKKRMLSINSKFKNTPDVNMTSLREQVSRSGSIKLVEKYLENWDSIHLNQGQCFTEVMEVFKEFWNRTDNVSDIQKVSNIICMNIIPKLESTSNPIHDLVINQSRDARNVFKRQVRRNTNYLKDLADPNTGSIQAKDLNNQDKKTIDGINPLPDKTDTSDLLLAKNNSVKESTVIASYTNMSEVIEMMKICDRVLSNHNKLSKRFNIDKTVLESVNSNNDIQDCIYELCRMIDTYDNMPFKVKYNVALENVLFVLYKNGAQYENSSVLKDITEYFLYKSDLSDDNKKGIKDLLEKTSFYGDTDKIEIDFMVDPDDSEGEYTSFMNSDKNIWVKDAITEVAIPDKESIKDLIDKFKLESNKTIEKVKNVAAKIYTKTPENIIEETPNFLSWIRTTVMLSTIAINPIAGVVINFTDQLIALDLKRNQADKAVAAYNKEREIAKKKLSKMKSGDVMDRCEKYIASLDSSITKLEIYRDNLYTDKELEKRDEVNFETSLESAINNPTIEEYINGSHPGVIQQYKDILGRLKRIATTKIKQFIQKHVLSFIEADELIKFESINSETIMNYLSPDDNKICMWLAKCLPANLKDEELTKKDLKGIYEVLDEVCDKLNNESPNDFIISYDGTDDLIYLYMTYTQPVHIEDPNIKDNSIHVMADEPIKVITTLEAQIESLNDWNPSNLMDSIDANIDKFGMDELDKLSEFALISPYIVNPERLHKILKEYRSHVYENVVGTKKYIIAECLSSNMKKLSENTTKSYSNNINRVIYELDAINALYTIISENTSIYEGTATNTIRLAAERLKKSITNLSDKEKMASRTIDASMNVLSRGIENASTNKNREAIIKGQVIPPASRIIKLAIAGGAAWAVNPALAVIGAIGMLAISKMASKKERQMLSDELDIELAMCEKRIQMAESNNDMKSLNELLKIQKKLQREKQRLTYRMKVYYRDNVPNVPSSGKDD